MRKNHRSELQRLNTYISNGQATTIHLNRSWAVMYFRYRVILSNAPFNAIVYLPSAIDQMMPAMTFDLIRMPQFKTKRPIMWLNLIVNCLRLRFCSSFESITTSNCIFFRHSSLNKFNVGAIWLRKKKLNSNKSDRCFAHFRFDSVAGWLAAARQKSYE